MAFEIDHSSIDTKASKVMYSTAASTSEFNPIRRKLNVNLRAQSPERFSANRKK